MNDPYIRNMMNNMDPSTMKNMFKNIDNMSDDQLRSMLAMSGRGDMDVTQFRNMSKNMANSSDHDLNRMKSMNLNTTGFPQTGTNYPNSAQPQIHKSNSTNIDDSFINDALNKKSDRMSLLESLKQTGNDYFRQKKYRESKEKYYEVLNKAEMYNTVKGSKEEKDLEELTLTVRLNISNCLINLEEYDLAIHESNKSLKLKESFKGYYRLGTAYFMKKNYQSAQSAFFKAKDLAKGDEINTVKDYLNKLQSILKTDTDSKPNYNPNPEKLSETTIPSDSPKQEEPEQPNQATQPAMEQEMKEPQSIPIEEQVNKKSTVSRIMEKESANQSKTEDDNIVIEPVEVIPIQPASGTQQSVPVATPFGNIDPQKLEESKKTVENMVSLPIII